MKIRILRHINGPGGVDWLPGEVHECATALARELISIRAAERVEDAPPSTGVEMEGVINADPAVTHRDPPSGRKGRR
jgi:hypothetical protein